jgi:hypothetical protein
MLSGYNFIYARRTAFAHFEMRDFSEFVNAS